MILLRALDSWRLRDKLLITAALTAPVMVALFVTDENGFVFVAIAGLIVWGLAGFWVGAPAFLLVPLLTLVVAPGAYLLLFIAGTSLAFLALLGGVAALVGGASAIAGAARVGFWGALARALTAGVGALFGTVV